MEILYSVSLKQERQQFYATQILDTFPLRNLKNHLVKPPPKHIMSQTLIASPRTTRQPSCRRGSSRLPDNMENRSGRIRRRLISSDVTHQRGLSDGGAPSAILTATQDGRLRCLPNETLAIYGRESVPYTAGN